MTTETSSGEKEIFGPDVHPQSTKKRYYHMFDDTTLEMMKYYFKIDEENQDAFLRYLKNRRVPPTTPNDV
jgi:hypothetical protein